MARDITGETFGYWTVVEKDVPQFGKRNSRWICRCVCGNTKSLLRFTLVNGSSKSCGCMSHKNLKGVNKTHGMSKTRLYREWLAMKNRCRYQYNKNAENYYLKGIKVCEEWNNNFEAFQSWALSNGYGDNLTLDRIDNALGYSPNNCRWVSLAEQSRNRTNTIFVDYNGQMKCLRTICQEINFPYKLAHSRYYLAKKKGIILPTYKLFEPPHCGKRT